MFCASSHTHSFTPTFQTHPANTTMSSRKRKPCPGCREGSYEIGSRSFTFHFRHHCHKRFLKEDVPNQTKRPRLTHDIHSNPTVQRNPLMASDTLTSSFSENPFDLEGSPPDPPEQATVPLRTEPNLDIAAENPEPHTSNHLPVICIQHDAANLSDKKRNAQGITHGSMHFQIQLADIMQKNGCPMKMHDEVINLVNNGLTTGSLRADAPPLLSWKTCLKQVEQVFQSKGTLLYHIT